MASSIVRDDYRVGGTETIRLEVMGSPSAPYYYSVEVGFMYGHSSGKFGGDEFGTYIDGTVGNDKFQINAGASYQEWNGRFPRRIR